MGDFIEALYDTGVAWTKGFFGVCKFLMAWAVATLVCMVPLTLIGKLIFPTGPLWGSAGWAFEWSWLVGLMLVFSIAQRLEKKKQEVERKVIDGKGLLNKIFGR